MQIQILVSGLPVEGTAYRTGESIVIHTPDIAQKTDEAQEYLAALGLAMEL
jgi:hypothetical protein